MGFDREKLNRLSDEGRGLDDPRRAQERRAEYRRIVDALNGTLGTDAEATPGKSTQVGAAVHELRLDEHAALGAQEAFTKLPWQPQIATFDDYRVAALREVLARLDDRDVRRAVLAAAEPAIAHRVTDKRQRASSAAGQAMWNASERRAATLYRHAQDNVEVAGDDHVVEEALQRCGSGHPLPTALRTMMERELGISLARVRIHTDAVASNAARAVHASAFTVGEDIFFAEGAFAPDTREGQRLLAHELTHVVQAYQGRTATGGAGITVSGPADSLEREAETVAERIATSKPRSPAEPALRRKYERGSMRSPVAVRRGAEAANAVARAGSMLLRQEAAGADAASAPDASTKYTFRRKKEYAVHVGPLPGKVSIRWEISRRDKALLSVATRQKGKVAVGSQQLLLEQTAKGLDAKVAASVVKANFDLLADGKLPGDLGTLPVVPRVEIKGVEGGLSIKEGLDFKLVTLAVHVDGDFSQFLLASARSSFEVKGQLRIECALAPELAKHVVELAKAGDAVTRSAKLEKEIAGLERSLKRANVSADTRREVEQKLKKLRRVREGVDKARIAALKRIDDIGVLLDKSLGGRLVKKISHKALATIFKKFIPLYNIVSTAQDITEAAVYLAGLDWGSIGDRIVDGGDGGTALSDGSHDGGTRGGGDGFGDGGTADGGDVDPDAVERELEQEANPELHATAKSVLAMLEKSTGEAGPSNELSKEDKETLNIVIPPDLTPDEIEAMKNRLATASTTPQDLVTSVIEAVQQVRPLGQQRLGPSKTPSEDVPNPAESSPTASNRSSEVVEKAAKPSAKARPKAKGNQNPGTWIVDPTATLRRVIKVDEQGNVTVPSSVEFPGFQARVAITGVAPFSGNTGADGTKTSAIVKVAIIPMNAPDGLLLSDGRAIVSGTSLDNVTVFVEAM